MKKLKDWDEFFNPLYIPLVIAVPIEIRLLYVVQDREWTAVELTSFIIAALFLIFSGIVEMGSEEAKQHFFGHFYLGSAVLFGILGFIFY
ncbi:hypothetical protein [Thalassobacillus pellis]|uniref:hypothetical protein n=1 Tax=Thalassobacillus pellis TaxID=748008 RepID=UPI00195FDC9B|nr:hypothetical protein [Thalassobacillus pellis]MBM7553721.1 hypothetical protein [Thalassobacillus pellis]